MPEILAEAGNCRDAEELTGETVIPLAPFIQPEQLEGILTTGAENRQCREAAQAPEIAAIFWTRAPQLHGHAMWTKFVKRMRELAPDSE
ncbi:MULTISPECIES: hypothetical protein [unclassified Kitasatospora]|uniref:hypothetical protein n=1 Tax=unclassified Kitasatospora TaxID=2633591 RepID=UPI0012FC3FB8|nr:MULTISPECIES: hypothetical protein [unclassified Kitasatospora]